MRLLLAAALLALTAAAAHGQTVGGDAYGVVLSTPLAVVAQTQFVALPSTGGVMHSTLAGAVRRPPSSASRKRSGMTLQCTSS